jgi:hypothetical protein
MPDFMNVPFFHLLDYFHYVKMDADHNNVPLGRHLILPRTWVDRKRETVKIKVKFDHIESDLYNNVDGEFRKAELVDNLTPEEQEKWVYYKQLYSKLGSGSDNKPVVLCPIELYR